MSTTSPPAPTRPSKTVTKDAGASQRLEMPSPREKKLPYGIQWVVVGWLSLLHVGSIASIWTFSWSGLGMFLFLSWLSGSVGICMGFHRYFTHAGFKTSRPLELAMAVIGGLAGEGSIIDWVATHREHHALSDQDGDPHSPSDGSWWSHMLWLARRKPPEYLEAYRRRWAPDLVKDPGLVLISNAFLLTHFITGALLYGIGYAIGGNTLGLSWLVWGLFLRLTFVLHSTWFVNSASHMFGYRNYETTDDSRNNWWVAILAYGEGWHNNHHAYPRMAKHGHKWWEVDLTYGLIRLLAMCGLVWDVVDYRDHSEKDKTAAAS